MSEKDSEQFIAAQNVLFKCPKLKYTIKGDAENNDKAHGSYQFA